MAVAGSNHTPKDASHVPVLSQATAPVLVPSLSARCYSYSHLIGETPEASRKDMNLGTTSSNLIVSDTETHTPSPKAQGLDP